MRPPRAGWYWLFLQLGAIAAGIYGGIRLFDLISQ
jgi:hypothetical protein